MEWLKRLLRTGENVVKVLGVSNDILSVLLDVKRTVFQKLHILTALSEKIDYYKITSEHTVLQQDKILQKLTVMDIRMAGIEEEQTVLSLKSIGIDNSLIESPIKANGFLDLRIGGSIYRLIGGPYRNKPDYIPGVKLAEEIKVSALVKLDIVDFQVPTQSEAELAVLEAFVALSKLERRTLYCGCMGGIGRTGLFLALMVKVWQNLGTLAYAEAVDSVQYVREYYISHAVETKQQQDFVSNFDAGKIAKFIMDAGLFKK